jgi:hypothetical protein
MLNEAIASVKPGADGWKAVYAYGYPRAALRDLNWFILGRF